MACLLVLYLGLLAACRSEGPTATLPPPPTTTPAPTKATVTPTLPTPPPTRSISRPPTPEGQAPATRFPVPPERDLYRLALELQRVDGPVNRVVNPEPVSYEQGSRETFWLFDVVGLKKYRSEFELRLVTPHAYWYFEVGLEIDQASLERSASIFEGTIYPRVTEAFGQEWVPGVDNDPHLNIVHARLNRVGGYFSSTDEYPREIRPGSNEREVIYINTGGIPVDSPTYLNVLAHELQHAIHWWADPSEETWINEGLAELATIVAGRSIPVRSASLFLSSAPTSLVHWPTESGAGYLNYGAAFLFMSYLVEHYGDLDDLRPLLADQSDGVENIESFLESRGHAARFADVLADWGVANLLDEQEGLYRYSNLPSPAIVRSRLDSESPVRETELPQFATDYVALRGLDGKARLEFNGADTVNLLPVDVGLGGCWWSNSGDSISSTLTRPLDLRTHTEAAVTYEIWHSTEEDWDFGYLQISADSGTTWDVLSTPNTSPEDPLDVAFGPGYTGESGGWVAEEVPLDAYAGQEVLVRFHYLTDDALNGHGLCLREFEMSPQLSGDDTWRSNGFVWTNNLVRQTFIVQVVRNRDGANEVTRIELDGQNRGGIVVDPPERGERLVVVVQATAPATRLPASYTLSLEPVD